MKAFIKRNKTLAIVGAVCLVLAILLFFAIFGVFITRGEINGDRLAGAPEVQEHTVSQIKSDLQGISSVKKVDFSLNVRTINFVVEVNTGTKLEDARELADEIAEKLGTTITSFYDIQVLLAMDGESNDFPAIGYLAKNSSDFSWSNRGEQ